MSVILTSALPTLLTGAGLWEEVNRIAKGELET